MSEATRSSRRVEISKKLVLINSAASLATRILSLSVLVWLQQYLLKRVSPDEYQLLPVLYSVMMFAPLIAAVLTGGLGRYIVEAYARDDDDGVVRIVSTMFPILSIAGAIFLAFGWAFAWYVGDILTVDSKYLADARLMMALLMFSAAIRLPLAPFSAGLVVRQKFWLQSLIGVASEVLRLSLMFTLLFGISTRVLWVIVAGIASDVVNLTLILMVSRRLVPALRFDASRIHWPIAKEITSFGGWSFLASLAETIRNGADPIILNKLSTSLEVTCLYLGTLVVRHVDMTVRGFITTMNPALISMHASNDRTRLKWAYLRCGRLGLWLVLLPSIPLMIYGHKVIELYAGSTYSTAAAVMGVSLLYFPLNYGFLLVPAIANAVGRIRGLALLLVGVNLLNVAITLYLVGVLDMGAFGAALATIIAIVVVYPVFMVPFALRLTGATLSEWLKETMFFGTIPGLAASFVWLGLKPMTHDAGWITLGVCFALGAACYLAVLYFVALRSADRRDLYLVSQRLLAFAKPRTEP